MIALISKQPEVYQGKAMPEASSRFRYFRLTQDGKLYGFAALDIRFPPYALLHLEVERWGRAVLKEMEKDWVFAKNIIRSLDCNVVVLTKAGNLATQGSYKKLIDKFGFDKPVEFTQSSQEI